MIASNATTAICGWMGISISRIGTALTGTGGEVKTKREYIVTIDYIGETPPGNKELIRCEDCKHRSEEMYDYYNNPNDKRYVCQINDLAKKPDWYCADGERR